MNLSDAISEQVNADEAVEEAKAEGAAPSVVSRLEEEASRAKAVADAVRDEVNAKEVARRKGVAKRDKRRQQRRQSRDRYYRGQNPRKYRCAYAALDDDADDAVLRIGFTPFKGATKEKPPAWFRSRMPRRTRQKRGMGQGGHRGRSTKRRGSRSSRGSPDDDPGEPEPELGLDGLVSCGIPMCIVVVPADEEAHDG